MLSNCWDRTKQLGEREITESNQTSIRKKTDETEIKCIN